MSVAVALVIAGIAGGAVHCSLSPLGLGELKLVTFIPMFSFLLAFLFEPSFLGSN